MNPEKGLAIGEPFQGCNAIKPTSPGLSLRYNPGLKLANAFGVNSNKHYGHETTSQPFINR
jgi:hypothetical protein